MVQMMIWKKNKFKIGDYHHKIKNLNLKIKLANLAIN